MRRVGSRGLQPQMPGNTTDYEKDDVVGADRGESGQRAQVDGPEDSGGQGDFQDERAEAWDTCAGSGAAGRGRVGTRGCVPAAKKFRGNKIRRKKYVFAKRTQTLQARSFCNQFIQNNMRELSRPTMMPVIASNHVKLDGKNGDNEAKLCQLLRHQTACQNGAGDGSIRGNRGHRRCIKNSTDCASIRSI